jgi:hypothetical protein
MSQFSSPLKLAPTSAKRGKTALDWQECVIYQTKSPEKLYILEAASPGHNLDHEIEFKVLHGHVYDNAQCNRIDRTEE